MLTIGGFHGDRSATDSPLGFMFRRHMEQGRKPQRFRLFERFHRAADGGEQLKFYDEGVGSAAGRQPVETYQDGPGGTGDGIQRNILQAYCWLIEHYDSPSGGSHPEIYIFGFSRGAFTARLLAGLLGASGLLKRQAVMDYGKLRRNQVTWDNELVQLAWSRYKPGRSAWRSVGHRSPGQHVGDWENIAQPVPVRLLGVWDTVGRYGVPTWSWGSGFFKPIRFGDSLIGRHVEHARHAMAIDEHRAYFNIRLWEGASATWASANLSDLPVTTIHQQWFAGAHAQVGGGYENDLLCHHPLQWMAEEARTLGLGLMEAGPKKIFRFAPLSRDHLAQIIDSHAEFAFGQYRWISDPIARQIRVGSTANSDFTMTVDIAPSVDEKVIGDAAYRPSICTIRAGWISCWL
jgi:uncharacterized protein (DUF2235 family)